MDNGTSTASTELGLSVTFHFKPSPFVFFDAPPYIVSNMTYHEVLEYRLIKGVVLLRLCEEALLLDWLSSLEIVSILDKDGTQEEEEEEKESSSPSVSSKAT